MALVGYGGCLVSTLHPKALALRSNIQVDDYEGMDELDTGDNFKDLTQPEGYFKDKTLTKMVYL